MKEALTKMVIEFDHKRRINVQLVAKKILVTHCIVPHSCRTELPERHKTYLYYDIVSLCYSCDLDTSQSEQERMNWIEHSLRQHLNRQENTQFHFYSNLRRVKKYAQALKSQIHRFPEKTL